jgi:hypothetical protein
MVLCHLWCVRRIRRFLTCRQLICGVPAFVLLASMTMIAPALARPDTTGEELLYVGRIDPDCHPDSVWGHTDRDGHVLVSRIVWAGYDTAHIAPCPPGSPVHYPKYQETTFEYPAWPRFSATVAIQPVNLGDSLADLVFYLRGGVPDSTNPYDSTRVLLLYGGVAIDTVPTINLASLPSFQIAPFVAIELHTGTHLVEPAHRDLSEQLSYVLSAIEPPEAPPAVQHSAGVAWNVRVYPNPAHGSTQIEGRPVPEGTYRAEVIAVDGRTVIGQEITVGAAGDLFGTLDLKSLPSSLYIIRIYNADHLVGTFPIVTSR